MEDVKTRKFTFQDILVNLCRYDKERAKDYVEALKSNEVLSSYEKDIISAFETLLRDTGEVPSVDLMKAYCLDGEITSDFVTNDLMGVVRMFIQQRKNEDTGHEIVKLGNLIKSNGVTPDISDKISEALKSDVTEIEYQNIKDRIVDIYETQVDNSGIKTGIAPVDEVVGGLKAGQVSVVAGFTGMGKSICSVSIMHSAMEQGYNVCYISLELSSGHLMYNLISRHSLDSKFSKKIEHRNLKSKTLSRTEWDYVKSDILPDLEKMPGKFYILDEQDLEGYNYFAFDNKLQEIENLCFKETGKGLDLIIVDHIQMLAFSDQGSRLSENTIINRWCNYFRSQCLDFLKSKRQIHVILVAQINRQGYLKAARNNGMYDMTALKEANEIETCASVILGIFSDTALIASKQTKVGVLKNRDGSRVGDAYIVSADYPYQLIGGSGSTIESVMSDSNVAMSTFDNMMDNFADLDGNQNLKPGAITFIDPGASDEAFVASDLGTTGV